MIWFFRFLTIGFSALGVALVVTGAGFRRLSPALLSTWTPTTGVVVDVLRRVETGDHIDKGAKYYHKLRYTDPSGHPHEVWTELWLRHELARGVELPLRYNPDDPGEATTLTPEDGGGRTIGCLMLGAGGFFALVGGYGTVLTF